MTKTIHRGKFTNLNAYIRKKRSQTITIGFHLKKLGGKKKAKQTLISKQKKIIRTKAYQEDGGKIREN